LSIKRVLIRTVYGFIILAVAASLALYIGYNRNLYVGNAETAGEIFIHGGMLFDAVDGAVVANPGIVLKEGIITCIGSSCEAPPSAVSIDATNLSILPGLVELHGHFLLATKDNDSLSTPAFIWNIVQARPDVRQKLLEAGITSFRSLGDPQDGILMIKDQLDSGELAGPRLFVAGPIFTAPGGHPTINGRDPIVDGFGWQMTFQSDSASVVRTEVARLATQGIDGVKAILHGRTSDDGEVLQATLSLSTLNAISEEARTNDFWVAVHVGQTSEHVVDAINAGATSIEHGVRGGNLISTEALELLVSKEIVYVPTLGREPLGHLNIPALDDAGVIIGVGTDTNNPEMSYGESYHLELSYLVDAGLSANSALLAATRNGAIGLRKSEQLGTIEEGKFADLILVNGEPWNDISELKSVEMVIQAGHIVVDKL